MIQTIEVLVVIDDVNKIYYTEDKNFAANDRESINQAQKEYFDLIKKAREKGYKIVKRETKLSSNSRDADIFYQYIKLLQGWRKILWDSAAKHTTAFLLPFYDDIHTIKEHSIYFKKYVSNEIYVKFEKEFHMTMFLLHQCLIDSTNRNLLPADEDKQLQIKNLILEIQSLQESVDMEDIILELKKEDPSTRKILESLELSQEKIEEIITGGYMVKSVLDVEPISELRKKWKFMENDNYIITEDGLFYSNFSDWFELGLSTIPESENFNATLVWLRENYGIKIGKAQPYPNGTVPTDSRVCGVYIVNYQKFLSDEKNGFLQKNRSK